MWTRTIDHHRAPSGASGAAQPCMPMSMRRGASGRAVRCLLVPCSSRRRQSSRNWCANSASEGCVAPDPVGGVPPPTRDRPIPTSVGSGRNRPGCQARPKHQIWCFLRQPDSAQSVVRLGIQRVGYVACRTEHDRDQNAGINILCLRRNALAGGSRVLQGRGGCHFVAVNMRTCYWRGGAVLLQPRTTAGA